MNTLDAIYNRWGCRKYSDEPIDKEVLGTILDAGRYAPSAGNLQDRSFIIVRDRKLKSEIAQAAGNQTWMQVPPIHIVVVSNNTKLGKFFGQKGDKIYSVQDTAFAVQNMLLAATDLNIGCSLIVGFNEEKICDLFQISPPAQPYAIIVLGHPMEPAKPSPKYPLENFVFFEKYGNKIADMDVAFGDIGKTEEAIIKGITSGAEKGKEEAKKTTRRIIEKVKSLFKRKKIEIPKIDSFMEEVKKETKIEDIKPQKKEEIPRQLPKKY